MNVSEFDFDLPAELIAQAPAPERGASRLLVLHKGSGQIEHARVSQLPEFLRDGDLLVVNDTKVFPARLLGDARAERRRRRMPAAVEPRRRGARRPGLARCHRSRAMGRARASRAEASAWSADDVSRHARTCCTAKCSSGIFTAGARSGSGRRTARASRTRSTRSATCRCRRTSSATTRGAIASGIRPSTRASAARSRRRRPGFTSRRRSSTRWTTRGVERAAITLHVGYGTFQPVRVEQVEAHTRAIPSAFRSARRRPTRSIAPGASKRRVVAVGTTTTRALEAAGRAGRGVITPQSGWTDLFIYPGFQLRASSTR